MTHVDHKVLLQGLNHAVAVAVPESGIILFENARFFDWFAPGDVSTGVLFDRIPGLDWERVASRIEAGRAFETDVEGKKGARTIPVRLSIKAQSDGDDGEILIVEGVNISKEVESQYMLDSYSKMAEKNAREIEKEKSRVEKLLLNIMPKAVYEELKDFGVTTPHRFDSASILMLDFVGFTDMAISHDPSALISELNDIFSAFDRIADMFSCDRIRTIGDAYMAACGLPEENPDHAVNIAKIALRMRRYIDKRNNAHTNKWQCRIGINTGPVIGSLVGIQKYVYDLFGPGANLAARMESMSEPMKITVNQDTYDILKDDFVFTPRGEHDIKGFGPMNLYFLEDEHRAKY
jgi:adenylate cyclase